MRRKVRTAWVGMSDEDTSQTDVAAQAPAPVAKPRRRWVVRLVAFVLLTPMVLILLAFMFLLDRDIAAPDWVIAEIEQRGTQVLSGGRLDVTDVTVNVGRDLHPRVRLQGTTVRDASGASLARIPVIESLFSPRGLIFQREALMQDLRISGAQLNLRRNLDGSVALSFQSGAADVEEAQSLFDLLDQSDRIFDRPVLAALETIRADGLIINYQDARAGRAWTVDGGQLMLDVRNETTTVTGDFAVLSGGAGITTLGMRYESPRDSQAANFELAITDALAADIAAQSPALSWLADIDAPISATLKSARTPVGGLSPLQATLSLGAGALQPNSATDPITFESASADLSFDPQLNVITFGDVNVAGELGRMHASGQAFLTDLQDGLPQAMAAQFTFTDTSLNPPDLYDAPVEIPHMQLDMQIDLQTFAVSFGQIYAQLPGIEVISSGHVAATDQGWDLSMDVTIPAAGHAAVLKLWPEAALLKVRKWVVEAIRTANLADVQMSLRKPIGDTLQVAGSFGFTDTELTFLRSMPPIENGAGTAVFTADVFAVSVNGGQVTAPTGGTLDITGTTMIIPDLKVQYRPADYALTFDGNITDMLAMLELPPLGFMTKAKLPVDATAGTATVQVSLHHPMRRDMKPDDILFAADAVLRNVDSDVLVPDRNLRASELRLSLEKESMTISGTVRVDGVPANATFTQRFTGSGGSTVNADVALTAAHLQTFGVELPPGSVSGEGRGDLTLEIPRAGAPIYAITSDLRGLQIAIPAVGWAKPPTVAGRLTVEGRLGDSPQVDQLSISGGGLEVRGDVSFNAAGGLDRARLTRVEISNWLNAPITLRGRGPGRPLGVEVGGGVIDLRRASFGSGGGDTGPISIALDRLQITEGIALNRFVGNFTSSGGFAGEFGAWINNVGQIRGTVAPRNGRSAVRIESNDAGGVALATGLMRNAVGGVLDLTLLPAGGDGTFDGRLAIRDLRIKDAPSIAALLDAISVVGLLQQLDGQGLVFDAVDAAFRITPERIILTESSAVGPGLGISLDGLYTLGSGQMDFQGVISPFYLINSIGAIFTRRGEGLIGFNFNIAGSSTAPEVSVNPLSAFTPGMFREIFRRDPPVIGE